MLPVFGCILYFVIIFLFFFNGDERSRFAASLCSASASTASGPLYLSGDWSFPYTFEEFCSSSSLVSCLGFHHMYLHPDGEVLARLQIITTQQVVDNSSAVFSIALLIAVVIFQWNRVNFCPCKCSSSSSNVVRTSLQCI